MTYLLGLVSAVDVRWSSTEEDTASAKCKSPSEINHLGFFVGFYAGLAAEHLRQFVIADEVCVPGVQWAAHHHGFDFWALAQPVDQGGAVFFGHVAAFCFGHKAAVGPAAKFQAAWVDEVVEQGVDKDHFVAASLDASLESEAEFLKFAHVQFLAQAAAALFGHVVFRFR